MTDKLREALEAAATWHDEQDKALSSPQPSVSIGWRRAEHQKQAGAIRAVLASQPADEAAREEAVCSCGAGHGSLEGHLSWCGFLAEPQSSSEDFL